MKITPDPLLLPYNPVNELLRPVGTDAAGRRESGVHPVSAEDTSRRQTVPPKTVPSGLPDVRTYNILRRMDRPSLRFRGLIVDTYI